MGLIETLFGPSEPSGTERELEQFMRKRQYERDVVESAAMEWILQSGLGPLFFRQTEDYAQQAGVERWPPGQHEYLNQDHFDPRREDHREIAEYIAERSMRECELLFDSGDIEEP